MAILPQPLFYVYILARPNGKPFYVGKGCKSRVLSHDAEARRGCVCQKCQVIRKIWKSGKEINRYIVFTTDYELEALEYEKETIALHGRNNLCNQSDGGQGLSNPKESTRLKKKESARKANANPELRARHAERMRKQWQDPEYHARQMEFAHQRATSQETKARQSIGQKNRTDRRNNTKIKEYFQRPDIREKVSNRMKEYYKDPVNRQKASERMRARYQESQGEIHLAPNSKITRERKSSSQKRRYADPEARRKTSEATRKAWAEGRMKRKKGTEHGSEG